MPSDLTALYILTLAVLPGFIAGAVERHLRPVRPRAELEFVVWCVFYSLVVHFILASAIVCIWELPEPAQKPMHWNEWANEYVGENFRDVLHKILIYFFASILTALAVGYVAALLAYRTAPVWYRQTVLRTIGSVFPWPRYKSGLSAIVEMNNGDKYFGTFSIRTYPEELAPQPTSVMPLWFRRIADRILTRFQREKAKPPPPPLDLPA